jgi:hypothetical protein
MDREFEEEWLFIERRLDSLIGRKTLDCCKETEKKALHKGWRSLSMPIFYALGRK